MRLVLWTVLIAGLFFLFTRSARNINNTLYDLRPDVTVEQSYQLQRQADRIAQELLDTIMERGDWEGGEYKDGSDVRFYAARGDRVITNIPDKWSPEGGNFSAWSEINTEYGYEQITVIVWIDGNIDGSLLWLKEALKRDKIIAYSVAGAALLWLVITLVLSKRKKRADRAIAKITRHIWVELKLIALVLIIVTWGEFANYTQALMSWVIVLAPIVYLLWSDLLVNGFGIFRHNSVMTGMSLARRFLSKKPFQKRMWWDLIGSFFGTLVLTGAAAGCFIGIFIGGGFPAFAFFILFGSIAVLVAAMFVKRWKLLIGDLGRLCDTLEVTDMNGIQDGLSEALRKAKKSERMKADLVTNVSHDLKTPLTSIISYVELLSRTELSDEAREHVEVLERKSERLKALIQDLFDLAKSTSGDAELRRDTIDLAMLADQTLSERDDNINLKVKIDDRPLWVNADGAKMSRVLHNLLDNAAKYSLEGTRVYVTAQKSGGFAVFEMKNVANYEMNFDPADIAERFIRGDEARSTDGSGLGLAIARSFTEACGGTFDVDTEGDLFKTRITLPIVTVADPAPRENLSERPENDLNVQL